MSASNAKLNFVVQSQSVEQHNESGISRRGRKGVGEETASQVLTEFQRWMET